MEQPNQSKNPVAIGVISVVVLLALVGAVVAWKGSQGAPETATTQETTTENSSTGSAGTTNGTYKDGTFSSSAPYTSPGGVERVNLTVTLVDDKITEATVKPEAGSPTAEEYQAKFLSGYKSLVVGKDIDEVEVSKVSGSSLTSRGFNDALENIKDQAQES